MGYFYYPCMGEITIFIDNHRGQNKNSIVIWFIVWLIENVVFNKLTLFLYVQGHTMKASDFLFNIMKGVYKYIYIYIYRYIFIYIFQDMVQALNFIKQIKVITMKPYQVLDYDKFL